MFRVEASGNLISLMSDEGVLLVLFLSNKEAMVALIARSTAALASWNAKWTYLSPGAAPPLRS